MRCVAPYFVVLSSLWVTACISGESPSPGTLEKALPSVRNSQPRSMSLVVKGVSGLSLNEIVKLVRVDLPRIRRQTATSMLRVKNMNGTSYRYKKLKRRSKKAKLATSTRTPGARLARGYGYPASTTKKGYVYKKPGYVYTPPTTTTTTTTTTRLPPIGEIEENSGEAVGPSTPDPIGTRPDRDFVTQAPTTTPPPLDPWDVRDNVPGEPGKDYAVYSSIPTTNFTCEGRTPGFYADPEAGCQVFHRCTDDPWYSGQVRVTMDSFLCPNGSLFNQQIFSCDWWGNVDCETTTEFYQLNEQIGQLEETQGGTVQYVQFTGIRVPPPPGQKKKAPTIVPITRRKPLPDKYRTKTGYDHKGQSIPTPNNGEGVINGRFGQTNPGLIDDPDDLSNKFLEEQDNRGFSELSAGAGSKEDDKEKVEESSGNVEEVTVKPPKSKGKKAKKSKKSKKTSTTTTTTTTTTTEAPEAEDDGEEEEGDEDATNEEEDTEEEAAATNNNDNSGFIVNRKPMGDEEEEGSGGGGGGALPDGLKPPDFTGEPVGGGGEVEDKSEVGGEESMKPSTEGALYIPPTTTTEEPKSGGYADAKYLPPDNPYLPPTTPNPYAYLPPTSPPGGYNGYGPGKEAYGPPPQQRQEYGPPPQQRQEYAAPPYLPPRNNYYSPSHNPAPYDSYSPPQSQRQTQYNEYLPSRYEPEYGNILRAPLPYGVGEVPTGGYSDKPENEYLPPKGGYGYDYAPKQAPGQYLPPVVVNQTYLPPQDTYLPPRRSTEAYLPHPTTTTAAPSYPPQKEYLPMIEESYYIPPKHSSSPQYPLEQYNSIEPSYSSYKTSQDYLPALDRYSTLPVQTPPSREGFTYGEQSSPKFIIIKAPMVAYSRSMVSSYR